jgi:nitroreductase
MNKSANAEYPIHHLISERWSPRAFDEKPIEKEKLLSIFEAARWAPSGGNKQPWYFIYATKDQKEAFQKLLDCLDDGNKIWCKDAALLIVTTFKTYIDPNQILNRTAMFDLGLATENLILQALWMDIYMHPMGGFNIEKIKKIVSLPDGYEPGVMIAGGYLGLPGKLPENLRIREEEPRIRKKMEEFVFEGEFKLL